MEIQQIDNFLQLLLIIFIGIAIGSLFLTRDRDLRAIPILIIIALSITLVTTSILLHQPMCVLLYTLSILMWSYSLYKNYK